MKAVAALIHEPGGPFSIEEVQTRDLIADEVLVRMRGVGICRTDLSAAAGHLPLRTPFVLGHEGAGIVESVGPGVTELCVGDHVVLSVDSCRTCASCRSGHPGYCELALGLNYPATPPTPTTTATLPSNSDEVALAPDPAVPNNPAPASFIPFAPTVPPEAQLLAVFAALTLLATARWAWRRAGRRSVAAVFPGGRA